MEKLDDMLIKGLKVLKEDYGITYAHLAEKVNVTQSAIARFKDGDTTVLGYEKKIELLKLLNQYLDKLPKSV